MTVPDFDYTARPQQRLEIPIAQRIAEIRARKRDERARAAMNAARRSANQRGQSAPSPHPAPGRTVVHIQLVPTTPVPRAAVDAARTDPPRGAAERTRVEG